MQEKLDAQAAEIASLRQQPRGAARPYNGGGLAQPYQPQGTNANIIGGGASLGGGAGISPLNGGTLNNRGDRRGTEQTSLNASLNNRSNAPLNY